MLNGSKPDQIKKFKPTNIAKAKPGVVATVQDVQQFGEMLARLVTFAYVAEGVVIIGKDGSVAA